MFIFDGERLSTLRRESNINQTLLAEYLEVDQSFISKIEKNERQPSTDLIDKLCNLFGCPNEVFFEREKEFAPMDYAFRTNGIGLEEIESIAVMNKLALNLKQMDQLLEGE